MKFELVIACTSTEVIIALLKDKKLIELHKEKHDNDYSVGDIYLGKVKKIIPGLNASFINVGHPKDGFLHYLDLGSQINSFNDEEKTVKKNIKKKYEIIRSIHDLEELITQLSSADLIAFD